MPRYEIEIYVPWFSLYPYKYLIRDRFTTRNDGHVKTFLHASKAETFLKHLRAEEAHINRINNSNV